jgi:hypothetical protein
MFLLPLGRGHIFAQSSANLTLMRVIPDGVHQYTMLSRFYMGHGLLFNLVFKPRQDYNLWLHCVDQADDL